jgi:acetyl esterase/lipase
LPPGEYFPNTAAPQTVPIREELDVVYGQASGEELKLDLYSPNDPPGALPALVLIHGGGWSGGAKEEFRSCARSFAGRGYVAVTVNYRLVPRHRFPAQLQDVKCAVRWLRANGQRYHVDPECIGAMGGSAGGHLALLLGLTQPQDGFEGQGGHAEQSSKVRAVVDMSGPTDLTWQGWPASTEKILADFLGGSRRALAATYQAASPVTYVHRGMPPVLILHAMRDTVCPYEQARLLDFALRGAGGTSVLESIPDRGHFFDWTRDDWDRCDAVIRAFLDRHLK